MRAERCRVILRPVAAVGLAGVFLAMGCRGGATPEERHEGDVRSESEIFFVEVGADAGLTSFGPTFAAAAADLDRDGWPDLAVSMHGVVALYRNGGGGRFVDWSSMGEFSPGDTHGLSWTDLDADGWLDLFVSIGAARGFGEGPNRIHRNLAGRGFALEKDPPDVLADPRGRGRCTCPADVDGDGTLELMVFNAPQPDRPHRLGARREGRWVDVASRFGLTGVRAEGLTPVVMGSGGGMLYVAYGVGADSGRFFRLGDDGRLADVTEALGVAPGPSTVMSVATGDFDNDGDLDIYLVGGLGVQREVRGGTDRIDYRLVAHQPGTRHGFRFRVDGRLQLDVLIGGRRRPEMVRLGRGRVAVGELPWMGEPDDDALQGAPEIDDGEDRGVFLWRDGNELVFVFVGDGGRYRAVSGHVAAGGAELISELQPPARTHPAPNRLLENTGGSFADVTGRAGVGDPASGRDAVFADVDNDGDLDLFVVNGGTAFSNLPDVLYRNNGDGSFTDITEAAGVMGPVRGRGGSALAFDYDRDGAVDLFACNGDGPPPGNDGPLTLFRNRTAGGGWVEVDLVGGAANRFAIGALVTARFGDGVLAQQRNAGTGRFSTSVLPLHIGIGKAPEVEIEVLWPSGATERIVARSGERLTLEEAR